MTMRKSPRHGRDSRLILLREAPLDTRFDQPVRAQTWDTSYVESPMSGGHYSENANYASQWRQSESPYMTFSPGANSQGHQSRQSTFSNPFTPSRQEFWPMHQSHQSGPPYPIPNSHAHQQQLPPHPTRSMSYGQPEGGHNPYRSPPAGTGGTAFYDMRGGPPSLHTSTGSPATSISLSDGPNAPGQAHSAASYGLPQGWPPHNQTSKSMEYGSQTAQWYQDPANLPGVRE